MGRLLNLLQVQNTLTDQNWQIFQPFQFARLFNVSDISARKFLERYTKKGLFTRAKQNLYFFNPNRPQEFVLANQLYTPSYLSFETALSWHHLIPENVYSFTSTTSLSSREFSVNNLIFSYYKIKLSAFTGYTPEKINDEVVLMADPEKAFIDYLYFVALGKKHWNDRLALGIIDWQKASKYVKLFQNRALERKFYALRRGFKENRS